MKSVFLTCWKNTRSLMAREEGMATAEYAIGTVAATSFAGILVWILKQDWVRDALVAIIQAIF